MTKKKIFQEWGQVILGLVLTAFGAHLSIFANIGVAPWDTLGLGIASRTPLSYGAAMTIISVMVLVIDIILKEKIGFGTVFDACLLGMFVQFFNDLNPLPLNTRLIPGIIIMLTGTFITSFGIWIYMSASQGCGAKDALMVALGRKLPKLPIGLVGVILWVGALGTGWLLGGPIGVGTLIGIFGSGLVMQIVFGIVKFEPREVKHKDVLEVVRILIGKDQKEEII